MRQNCVKESFTFYLFCIFSAIVGKMKGGILKMLNTLIFIFMAIVGGVPCVLMLLSIPVLIVWKLYRKCKYNISMYD